MTRYENATLDARMLERVYNLLCECGAPNIVPDRSLLIELYWMIKEHYDESEAYEVEE